MKALPGSTTDPRVLGRVADLGDQSAWREFFGCYDPLVRLWGHQTGLDPESVDELAQRVWIALSRRMPSFEYDPGGTFRGWLRRLVRSRAADLRRDRGTGAWASLEEETVETAGRLAVEPCPERDDPSGDDPERLELLRIAGEVQEAVRGRVSPESWQAFWLVKVDGWSVTEVAEHLDKDYSAVFQSVRRVCEKLRTEGRRRLGGS